MLDGTFTRSLSQVKPPERSVDTGHLKRRFEQLALGLSAPQEVARFRQIVLEHCHLTPQPQRLDQRLALVQVFGQPQALVQVSYRFGESTVGTVPGAKGCQDVRLQA